MRLTRTTALSILVVLLLATALFASERWIRHSLPPNAITLTPTKSSFGRSEPIMVTVTNNTNHELTVENKCPKQPLDISREEDGRWEDRETTSADRECKDTTVELLPHESHTIDYNPWQQQLFDRPGQYRIGLEAEGYDTHYFTTVTVTE